MNLTRQEHSPQDNFRPCSRLTSLEFATRAIEVPFVSEGRGWKGWDCWGLLYNYFKDVHGLSLPSYDFAYEHLSGQAKWDFVEATYREQKAVAHEWIPLAGDNKSVVEFLDRRLEQVGDVFMIRRRGRLMHVGVIVEPGWFLHSERQGGTHKSEYGAPIWRRFLIELYRHRELEHAL